jgi:ribosomal protein L37AE/L43A
MPKGHKCPVCGTQTLQPSSTNRLKCSKCASTFPKNLIVGN